MCFYLPELLRAENYDRENGRHIYEQIQQVRAQRDAYNTSRFVNSFFAGFRRYPEPPKLNDQELLDLIAYVGLTNQLQMRVGVSLDGIHKDVAWSAYAYPLTAERL